jgi:uncharacterized RDD family membrane protein YckC
MNEQNPAAPPTPSAPDVTGSRIVAALIDFALMAGVFVIMAVLFGDSDASSGDDGSSFNLSLNGAPFIIFIVIVLGYYFVLESQRGQTIGKMVMGLRVAAVDGELSAQKVLIRTLLRIIDSLPFLYLIGFIVMLTSGRKQRIGDMAAGTVVVKA